MADRKEEFGGICAAKLTKLTPRNDVARALDELRYLSYDIEINVYLFMIDIVFPELMVSLEFDGIVSRSH